MRKRSAEQWLVLTGNLVLCTGLILNSFEVISKSVFRGFAIAGILVDTASLIVIWKRKEL